MSSFRRGAAVPASMVAIGAVFAAGGGGSFRRSSGCALARQQPEQGDQRLRVLALGDRLLKALQRPGHDLDALALLGLVLVAVAQILGQVEPHALVAEARAGVEAGDLPPGARALADLLRELALGGLERRLILHVELS